MRKLLVVLILFIGIIIGMIVVFNTTSIRPKQLKITPVDNLPSYPTVAKRLAESIRFQTVEDSTSDIAFQAFHHWLEQNYPTLFNNPNIEWQRFQKYSLVAKWIGRSVNSTPIILVSNQYVEAPDLAKVPEWKYNPFLGKKDDTYIYGRGTLGNKMTMLAQLESLNNLVKQNILPERTIYFVFPQNVSGEQLIANALRQAKIHPEFILKSASYMGQDFITSINAPVAFIGTGLPNQSKATITLQTTNASAELESIIENLQQTLPPFDLTTAPLKTFIDYLSPELDFTQQLIFSNSWLLESFQIDYLNKNPFIKTTFGQSITASISPSDTSNIATATINIKGLSSKKLESWIKNQAPNLTIESIQASQPSLIAPIQNRGYRILDKTIKEVFPNILTMPSLTTNTTTIQWLDGTPIYYFNPFMHTTTSWESAQRGIDDKISINNYERVVQFYHQLLMNNIQQ